MLHRVLQSLDLGDVTLSYLLYHIRSPKPPLVLAATTLQMRRPKKTRSFRLILIRRLLRILNKPLNIIVPLRHPNLYHVASMGLLTLVLIHLIVIMIMVNRLGEKKSLGALDTVVEKVLVALFVTILLLIELVS